MKLPEKIIKYRKANGWSQEDFAEKLNVSRQAISRWENGTALPDAQNILQISKLFHVTTDYLRAFLLYISSLCRKCSCSVYLIF